MPLPAPDHYRTLLLQQKANICASIVAYYRLHVYACAAQYLLWYM